MPRNFLMAILVSACLALLLSFVPGGMLKNDNSHIPTFRPLTGLELREHNLVDLFTTMSTHYNIKRVKWENRALYVDLVVPTAYSVDLSLLYKDFYSVTYQSLTATRNVEHLYLRLLAQMDTQSPKLLVAMEADRTQERTLLNPKEIKDFRTYVENTFLINRHVN